MRRSLFIFIALLAAWLTGCASGPKPIAKSQAQFDGANRLTNTITPLGYSTALTFNHQGLVSAIKDQASQPTALYYDAKGRLTNRTDNVGTTLYRYDANNNLTNIVGQAASLSWSFDAYNRASAYRDAYGNVIQYRYDASGNLTNLVYPGGKNVYYSYDALNRMTNVTDWAGRKTSITYDLAGRLTTITRPNDTKRTIDYDAAGQATNILEQMANGLPVAVFRQNWNASATMQWEFAAPLPHPATVPTRTMTYDADNRLATFDGLSVGKDDNGNLTSAPLTNGTFAAYAYDARNRLLNAGGITNAYDAMNNRIGQTVGTNTTVFVVNPNTKLPQVLMRIKNGVTNYYIYGAGLLYQITETATATNTLTYHYDYRGSTVALTDDNGLVTDRIEYSAYGTTTYRTGTNDTPFLFNGIYGVMTDPNGLLYMRARYYNPYLCRFINADPSGFSGGLNFYAYANGNPVSLIDPFGLQGIPSPANIAVGFGPGYGESVSDWNNRFQAANQQALPIEVSAAGGVVIGAGGAAVITVGAPLAVSGLTAAGLTPAAAAATVTTTLGIGALAGGSYTLYNAADNAASGNLNGVAFDLGTLWGAGFVGAVGGGRYIANNASPSPSTVPYSMNPFTSDYISTPTAPNGYGFTRNPNLPLTTDLWNWLGTGPTPSSGGGSAMGISAGASMFFQPLGNSSTGK